MRASEWTVTKDSLARRYGYVEAFCSPSSSLETIETLYTASPLGSPVHRRKNERGGGERERERNAPFQASTATCTFWRVGMKDSVRL